MALWKIEPTWKKSIREVMYFRKEGKQIAIETGWRWGEFTCETEDDNPPVIEEGEDLFSQGYDVEMQECTDGCWTEYEFDEFTEEEEEEMREWLDENSFYDLEEDGWTLVDSEFIMDCEPEITRIEK
jgi:hypothetical protein